MLSPCVGIARGEASLSRPTRLACQPPTFIKLRSAAGCGSGLSRPMIAPGRLLANQRRLAKVAIREVSGFIVEIHLQRKKERKKGKKERTSLLATNPKKKTGRKYITKNY